MNEIRDPEALRKIAETVFAQAYPGHEDFFAHVWERLATGRQERPKSAFGGGDSIGASGGMAAGEEEMFQLVADFFEQLVVRFPQSGERLLERLGARLRERGTSPKRVDLVLDAAKQAVETTATIGVWMDSLLEGNLSECEQLTTSQNTPCVDPSAFGKYELIVDELDHKVHVLAHKKPRRFETREIRKIRGIEATMLWLVLSHVNNGLLDDIMIRKLFVRPAGSDVYQYVTHLRRFLDGKRGNLSIRAMTGSRDGLYMISRSAWSFCWVRRNEDRSRSELLYRTMRRIGNAL